MHAPPLVGLAASAVTQPGTPVRLYLDDGKSAFSSSILESGPEGLRVAPVRPAHGNLILERLLGDVRMEVVIAGVPHVATTRVRSVSPGAVLLATPERVERVQRRRYFRVQVPSSISVHLQGPGGARVRELVDISGGGCAVRALPMDADLRVGAPMFVVQLPLSDGHLFVCSGVVRRARPTEWGAPEGELLGIEFVGVPPRDRQRLVSWVTEQERLALQARAAERERFVPDVIVLLHDADNHVRLKPGLELGIRGLRVAVGPHETEMRLGVRHERVEVRVGGECVLRGPVRVDRVERTATGALVSLVFVDLSPEARGRLVNVLRR